MHETLPLHATRHLDCTIYIYYHTFSQHSSMQGPFWHQLMSWGNVHLTKHVNQRSEMKMNTPERRALVNCCPHRKLVMHW